MSQFVVPNGSELITFLSWDQMPTGLRHGTRRAALNEPASFVAAYLSPSVVTPIEIAVSEEDAERWDGLS
jgi:hypothetical protein